MLVQGPEQQGSAGLLIMRFEKQPISLEYLYELGKSVPCQVLLPEGLMLIISF